jgi:signal transduction histidine kinase/ligand-binding sensor domain-containing protein
MLWPSRARLNSWRFVLAGMLLLMGRRADAQYRIDTWTTEQGLPTNSVTAVLQSRDGFLWMATYGGLVRFDGANLRLFSPGDTPGLRTSRLVALFESRDGALWITTEDLGLTRYYDGVFTTYTTAEGLLGNSVGPLFETADGAVVADTANGAVQWRNGKFEPYSGAPSYKDPGRTIVGRTADGVTWYRDDAGIHKFENGLIVRTLPREAAARNVFEDRAGRVWMHLRDRGHDSIVCYTASGRETPPGLEGLSKFNAVGWSEDSDGNVWLGMRGGAGIARFDGERFTRYGVVDGLPGPNVETIFQDREGTLWAPTDGGLARLTARPLSAFAADHGLEGNNTYTIYQDKQGDIWIGGWPGLTRYRNGQFESMSQAVGIAGQNVTALFEDRDGVLWIGVWDSGIRRLEGGRVTAIPSPTGAVVRAIHQGRGPDIWIGGREGLARYRDRAFVPVTGYPGGEVHSLFEDRDGALWIGTGFGVMRYADGRFTTFGAGDGLTVPAIVRSIYQDRDGVLWFGSYDSGILRFSDGRFTHFSTREGLFANGAFQIVEDAEARFWVTSNAGIYRVSRHELNDVAAGRSAHVTSVSYGTRDGMLHTECNGGTQPAGMLASDGRIWFPTQRGVVVVDPRAMPINPQPPPVVITQSLVANRMVESAGPIEIRSGPTSLEVQFAALTFARPELSRFKYRMEGLDEDWIDGGRERTARYAQLPYGIFEFRVIAANRDGVWNTAGARVQVIVVPPFWRTQWFFALVLVSLAALGYAGHVWRMRLLRREQDLQQAFSRQLIASQETERKRIAAGLHDGLSQNLIVIKNWALMGLTVLPEDHLARARLREIEGAAAAALSDVRDIVHDLTPYQLERLGVTQTICDMVGKVSDASGIAIECRAENVDGLVSKDASLTLFRVVQEAVNNIVKHSGAARAAVEIVGDRDVFRVRISDDGCGFAPDGLAEPSPARAGGFGLFGMAERVRMIGGQLDVESAPGHGTTIAIELPLQEAH